VKPVGVKIVALTADLMDRSKISASIPDVSFTLAGDADIVIVDVARFRPDEVQAAAPNARLVCYGPHVDAAPGVMPRSKFFRDPAAACR
jgi:hypothetical protein